MFSQAQDWRAGRPRSQVLTSCPSSSLLCEAVERRPAAPLLDFNFSDRVNLPDRAARFADLIRMLRVHHQPAADSDALVVARYATERVSRPRWMLGTQARRYLDDNRAAAVVV